MVQKSKKAFTLIELLVVITIIGILATWATAVYTSQIQKWRDATRLSSLEALRGWLEQVYQDKTAYPNTWLANSWIPSFLDLVDYVPKLPIDPKSWQKSGNSNFDYTYWVAADNNNILWQTYEISAAVENQWNVTDKAAKDWWNDWYRIELWISTDTIWTAINNWTSYWWQWAWTPTAISATSCITAASWTPVTTTTAPWTCNVAPSSTQVNSQTLIIR